LFILIFLAATGQMKLLGGLSVADFSWIWITAILLFGYVLTWYTGLKYIPVSSAACVLSLGAPITSLLQMMQQRSFDLQIFSGSILMFFGAAAILGLFSKIKKTKISFTEAIRN
jgi:drug/metabolite transporter (DMT)-like permease